jgi:hypothetical protein
MFKVRFNLSRGKNFKKWKVTYPSKLIFYYNPNEVTFRLTNCLLKNNKKTSEEIFDGANKRVCAWVECEKLEILSKPINVEDLIEIKYNPRNNPYWEMNEVDVDFNKFDTLVTNDNKIYV